MFKPVKWISSGKVIYFEKCRRRGTAPNQCSDSRDRFEGDRDKEHIVRDIGIGIAKIGGVVMLQCLLNIRPQTLIQRFSAEEEAKQQRDREMDHLEKYGFSMSDLLNTQWNRMSSRTSKSTLIQSDGRRVLRVNGMPLNCFVFLLFICVVTNPVPDFLEIHSCASSTHIYVRPIMVSDRCHRSYLKPL